MIKIPHIGNTTVEQILCSKQINPKLQDCESHSQGSEYQILPSESGRLTWQNYNKVHQAYQFDQNRLTSSYDRC